MPRERTYRTEAIVLSRRDLGEADRLLTLYTREFGKQKAIAKGARKPQSRKTGHVELFMRTNFLIAKGKTFDVITQAELVESYRALRTDLVRTTYASYAVELLDRFTPDEDKHVSLYELLAKALDWFGNGEDLLLTARYYELRLLSLVGYQPQLFQCVVSAEPIEEEDQYLSGELGGILKPDYLQHDRGAHPISSGAVKVLRYLQTRPWDTIRVLKLKRGLQQELETVMAFYLTYILERDLKSVDFLKRLREEAKLFAE